MIASFSKHVSSAWSLFLLSNSQFGLQYRWSVELSAVKSNTKQLSFIQVTLASLSLGVLHEIVQLPILKF